MSKTNQNFSMYRGESRTVFIELDTSDGNPFDVAGSNVQWWVGTSPYSLASDENVLIKKSLADGEITQVTDGVNVAIIADDTADMVPNIYYHELKIMMAGGGVSVATVGNMILRPALDMRVGQLSTGAARLSGTATVT